jgi:hypothetical protein
MLSRGEADALERQLRASLVALNKKHVQSPTLLEAIDEATAWSSTFDDLTPLATGWDLDALLERAPLVVCAAAAEIGFRFEGVGTEYWAKLADALGLPIAMAQRTRIGETFAALEAKYRISRPSESAFSAHFSIISWPIANALLPLDLIAPVTRLLARAPVNALPGSGRAANFASLRAWASAAEGARLADWLRFEGPTSRVLNALLTENRQSALPDASYARLRDAIGTSSEAFFAARAARQRVRTTRPSVSTEPTPGRLAISLDASGLRMFATWPALPQALFDEARTLARSKAWRPRLWGARGFLHPDTALSAGPFALALQRPPAVDDAAYPDAAEVFGAGSDIAAALAARTIDWNTTLLFDPNQDRTGAEQRFDMLSGAKGLVWIATQPSGADLTGLRRLGSNCGYTVFEADLADQDSRKLLVREGLLGSESRTLLARHPLDAIGAPQGLVRPGRPFLLYKEEAEDAKPQTLPAGGRIAGISGLAGRPGVRCEPAAPADSNVVALVLFEREAAFEALVERRLQLRVESRLPLVDLAITAELEISDRLVARGQDRLPALPMTVPSASPLLGPLYDDRVRAKLLEAGAGSLKFTVGRSVLLHVPVERPPALVEWTTEGPQLLGAELEAQLIVAHARHPHRFAPADSIVAPTRGATAYGLKLTDGRIADPMQILTSNSFDLGDFAAHFGDDIGSRRMYDSGRGVGDIARARIAWSRAICQSLPSLAARTWVVRQFEEPLVISLCGRDWLQAEQTTRSDPSDAHLALYEIALERGLATLPEGCTASDKEHFANAFRRQALMLDPTWPVAGPVPIDGAMDDALNAGFAEAVRSLHAKGRLLEVDEDDCDFGSVAEEWERAAADAIRRVGRQPLATLLAPSEGGRQLAERVYRDLSLAELAEDLAAWTKRWALPRGQLSPEAAAGALLMWLSPAACSDADAAVRVLAVDPFVARVTRYAALRLGATYAEAEP